MQSFLVRSVLTRKVLGTRGPRHHRVSFPGRRNCFATERTHGPPPLRSHHCQASGCTKQKSSHECFLPEETVLSVLQIDRPERKLSAQTSTEPLCFREADLSYVYCGWGTITGDVYVNDRRDFGRLRSEFPIPRTPEDGELKQSLVYRPQRRNDRDRMRLNPIRVHTRTRWQTDSGVLRLLTQMSIISGPGCTPHSTQALGRIGAASCGTRTSRPGLYVRLLSKR